jgi:hypothetical protein
MITSISHLSSLCNAKCNAKGVFVMPLSKPVTINNLKPYKQIGALHEKNQALIAMMCKIREGKVTTLEEVKQEIPDLSEKGLHVISALLASQAEGQDRGKFWSAYGELAHQYAPLKAWRDLVAAPSSSDAAVAPPSQNNPFSGLSLTEVEEPETGSWLWKSRIPLGKLTLIDGEHSVSRALVMVDLAARVASGKPMPDGTPGCDGGTGVVLIAPYEHGSEIMTERLQRAGTTAHRVFDLGRVTAPDLVTGEVRDRFFSLKHDLPYLEQIVDHYQIKLVIINPLEVTFGRYDIQNDMHVHELLLPLADLVQRKQIACVLMRDMGYLAHKDLPRRGYGALSLVVLAESALSINRPSKDNLNTYHLSLYKGPNDRIVPTLRFSLVNEKAWNTVERTASHQHVGCGCTGVPYSPVDKTLAIRWLGAMVNHNRKG